MANYLDAAGLNQYTTALKNGTLKVGAAGAADQVPASGIQGTIDLANLPAGALERMVVVADETARLAITKNDVQKGDTVKQTDTGVMYYVKDDSLLKGEDDGEGGTYAQAQPGAFEVYSAGSATSAPWSGITGKPESYTPSAHNQDGSTINALTGYQKAQTAGNVGASDSLLVALGKVEKKADDAADAAGSYAAIESTDIAAIIAGTWS